MYFRWLFGWTFLISLSSGQFSKSQLLGNSFGVPGRDATFDYVCVFRALQPSPGYLTDCLVSWVAVPLVSQ